MFNVFASISDLWQEFNFLSYTPYNPAKLTPRSMPVNVLSFGRFISTTTTTTTTLQHFCWGLYSPLHPSGREFSIISSVIFDIWLQETPLPYFSWYTAAFLCFFWSNIAVTDFNVCGRFFKTGTFPWDIFSIHNFNLKNPNTDGL